ncbi:MAG: hypothetical protein MUE40_17480 [Anaerolineae bacterium]|jgi:lipopolysaccharide transport system permease protein|nr:hypothetical protein [Anaerolineae bacterium]
MSNLPLPITSYSAHSEVRRPGRLLRQTLAGLWAARELAARLARRDLSARYRESFLGILWAVGPSLITVLTFSLLQQQQILNAQTGSVPYPVYVLFGTILWELFTGAILGTLNEVRGALTTLSKVNISREAFLISGLYKLLFDTTIKCLPLVILLLAYGVPLAASFPLALLPALGMMALGLLIALVLLPLLLLVQDIARLVTALLTFGLFVTPVLYPMPTTGFLSVLAGLNPVTPFLNTARAAFFGSDAGAPAGSEMTALVFGLALLPCLVIGLVLYRLTVPIVVERLGD